MNAEDKELRPVGNDVCFDEQLIGRYGGRGPRYTSYPTALQFTDQFTVRDYRDQAVVSNAAGKPLSIYVHIPFCHALCYYCACNKIVTRNIERVRIYLDCLFKEIELQTELFDASRTVEQLHFGGGTPTYLDEEQLRALMTQLRNNFNLDDSDDRQFSIEVDPRTVDHEAMKLLAEVGFNRLSLGVQDFDPTVQTAVNRVQSATQVASVQIRARDLGFRSISFDLIYGLPHQSVHSFDQTLEQVIAMQPDRLSVYNYAHLPGRFKGQRMIRDADIPSPEVRLDILHHTIDKLTSSGYVYIGMDHFALPGDELVAAQKNKTLQRNFQGYSTHAACDLIGLGVSAIGNVGNGFIQNSPSTIEYERIIEQGELPVKRGLIRDEDDKLRAEIIQQLMCYDALHFADIEKRFDLYFREYFRQELKLLEPLIADDLLEDTGASLHITAKGRLLLRSIAMVFDRYLQEADANRYSKAI